MRHRLFIDADSDCWMLRQSNPLWDDGLEILEIEARRLMGLFPLGKKAVIKRSSGKGWHLRFPESRLTWPEMEAALCSSPLEHHGHRCFSMMLEDDTLRVSGKQGVHSPYIVRIIEVG